MCNLTRSRLRQAYSLFAEVWKSIYSLTPVNVAGARNADIDSRQVFRQVHHHKLRSKGPFFKLPRSRSSPSPPDLKQAPGRPDSSRKYAQNGRVARRRPTSITTTRTKLSSPVLDWSTSYQAGSSSSASHSGSDADTEEDDSSNSARGRAVRQSWGGLANGQVNKLASPTLRRRSPSRDPPPAMNGRVAFTRSRSPVVPSSSASVKKTSTWSPLVAFFSHRKLGRRTYILMPAVFELHVRLPLSSWTWKMSVNSRRAGECAILLGSLLYATTKISEITKADSPTIPLSQYNTWIITELSYIFSASLLYFLWTHSTLFKTQNFTSKDISLLPPTPTQTLRPGSPRTPDTRDHKRQSFTFIPRNSEFGFIWMTVPKNYRESSDDGVFTGLLLGPLVASSCLYSSLSRTALPSPTLLPEGWLIEAPLQLKDGRYKYTPLDALLLSRYNLVNLATFCSAMLLLHVCASRWLESRHPKQANSTAPEGERQSVPRSEGRRSWYYILFTFGVSLGTLSVKVLFQLLGYGIWQHMNFFDVIIGSLFYQFTLYVAIRLAHRGFTMGELSLVCFGGTALVMELLNITIARIWPVTTPFIKTYRLPTPLVIFQAALIAGSFLTGFLLAPFLVLSRHLAGRPVRRLRNPEQKTLHRRYLALGFYIGAVLIVGGLIGMWTRWCLGNRDPWLWAIFRILEGRRKWSRPALLIYWASLGSLSVAGWNRQLARSRRYRAAAAHAGENGNVTGSTSSGPGPAGGTGGAVGDGDYPVSLATGATLATGAQPGGSSLGLTFPNLNLPNGATDLLDAADKHVPTLGLNARRKFFHALAVVMFVPGVAFDPAFTHLSFSVAFALFTFAEYVRYFALYPFGATVHLFMNEFLDHKDNGTAILSHFYLLTGCAGSLWLEGHSHLLQFTGILVLGIGDALASIVGKRIGNHRWSPGTFKTLEGSAAFVFSIVVCACALRLCGVVEAFDAIRYTVVVSISAGLEALSDQNDNLTLPLYMWTALGLAGM